MVMTRTETKNTLLYAATEIQKDQYTLTLKPA